MLKLEERGLNSKKNGGAKEKGGNGSKRVKTRRKRVEK